MGHLDYVYPLSRALTRRMALGLTRASPLNAVEPKDPFLLEGDIISQQVDTREAFNAE